MREILFRGKDVGTGKFKQGYYIKGATRHCITCSLANYPIYDIIPETLGQFTGLTDKNGIKIFEGDIVKITDKIVDFETYAFIEFGNPNGQYNWGWQLVPLENKPFAVEILHWVEMEETGAFIEVVGNIHDNPELLGGADK